MAIQEGRALVAWIRARQDEGWSDERIEEHLRHEIRNFIYAANLQREVTRLVIENPKLEEGLEGGLPMSDKTMWVITEGQYSDWAVIYVTESEELARAYYENFENGELNEPQEIPILEGLPERVWHGECWIERGKGQPDVRILPSEADDEDDGYQRIRITLWPPWPTALGSKQPHIFLDVWDTEEDRCKDVLRALSDQACKDFVGFVLDCPGLLAPEQAARLRDKNVWPPRSHTSEVEMSPEWVRTLIPNLQREVERTSAHEG